LNKLINVLNKIIFRVYEFVKDSFLHCRISKNLDCSEDNLFKGLKDLYHDQYFIDDFDLEKDELQNHL
jgi:hypothetical protein